MGWELHDSVAIQRAARPDHDGLCGYVPSRVCSEAVVFSEPMSEVVYVAGHGRYERRG